MGQIQLMQSPGGWTGKPRDDVQHWKAIAGREGNRARVLQSKEASEEGMAGKDNDLRAGQSAPGRGSSPETKQGGASPDGGEL